MKFNKACTVAVVSLALWAVPSYGQLTLNFAANTGASIQFNGSDFPSFQFNPAANGYQWHITSETGGSSAIGLNGLFSAQFPGHGPFQYSSIISTGSGLTLVQKATFVVPLADLIIYDGSGNLRGTVNFIDVETFATSGGGVNADLNVNLSPVVYSGSNPDLLFLQANNPGTLDLSFQFSPGKTLTQLSTGGPYLTSFSGSIIVVPEPSALALAGLGGLVLLHLRRRK